MIANEAHSAEPAATGRSGKGCLCCGSISLYREVTVVSAFLASRALHGAPELTSIVFCRDCGLRFFDRSLSEHEAARYYAGYRSDAYCRERNAHEPFYTRRAHLNIASWLESPQRRTALAAALAESGAPVRFGAVLDFGGGDGGLIGEIPCEQRAVFDLAGKAPLAGTDPVTRDGMSKQRWDLIVCAQTLEHVSDPRTLLATMAGLLAPQGWLYLEVPDEMWSNRSFAGSARDRWLSWLIGRRHLLIAADTVSTACRVLLGFLPPFGFIPMREHLQYFTEEALSALVRQSGLRLVLCGRNATGQIFAVATRAAPLPTGAP